LSSKLPSYMIPTTFMMLDSLPKTRHGKLDLKALPIPVPTVSGTAHPTVPPQTETQEQLVELWQEILKQHGFGIHDDFFELGGHSLLVTQVISRLRERLGVELPVRALFEAPTIAEFAERVEDARASEMAEGFRQSQGDGVSAQPPLVPIPRNQ